MRYLIIGYFLYKLCLIITNSKYSLSLFSFYSFVIGIASPIAFFYQIKQGKYESGKSKIHDKTLPRLFSIITSCILIILLFIEKNRVKYSDLEFNFTSSYLELIIILIGVLVINSRDLLIIPKEINAIKRTLSNLTQTANETDKIRNLKKHNSNFKNLFVKSIVLSLGLILLFSVINSNQLSQESQYSYEDINSSEYDVDYFHFLESNWSKNSSDLFSKEKFNFIDSFFDQLEITNSGILDEKFLTKPGKNDLIAIYLNRRLIWNSYKPSWSKKHPKDIIVEQLLEQPSENERLANYYELIFIHILNNQEHVKPRVINLEFDKLKLNATEGAILFLAAMKYLGNQMYLYSKNPENCFRAIKLERQIPLFNGKKFYEFELPKFNDFKYSRSKSKVSFKKWSIPEFQRAIAGYNKCHDLENE